MHAKRRPPHAFPATAFSVVGVLLLSTVALDILIIFVAVIGHLSRMILAACLVAPRMCSLCLVLRSAGLTDESVSGLL